MRPRIRWIIRVLTPEQVAGEAAEEARHELQREQKYGSERRWYCVFRHPKTTQEKRKTVDEMHKPFVRAKRNKRNLVDTYDPGQPCFQRTWKTRSKLRQQWMINLKRHMDTVMLPPKRHVDLTEDMEADEQ